MKNTRNLRMAFFRYSAYNSIKRLYIRMVILLELNLIQDDKLKVILTPFDMIQYNLTCDKIDYDNTETRKAVWEILDEAKHKTGFDAAAGKICIQVYPEKNGGCEIYITKLKNELPSSGTMNGQSERTSPAARTVRVLYRFDSIDVMLRVCKFLHKRGYERESRAYLEQAFGGPPRYYLLISEALPPIGGRKTKYLRENLFIQEFGTRIENENASLFLEEHCRLFCAENAVGKLACLAK